MPPPAFRCYQVDNPTRQHLQHQKLRRLHRLSGLSSSSSGGPTGDASSNESRRLLLEESLHRSHHNLRSSGGAGDTRQLPPASSTHPPGGSIRDGFSPYLPDIFRSIDPSDNIPCGPSPHHAQPLPLSSTMADDNDDELIPEEPPMLVRVKEALEKAGDAAGRMAGNHFEFCRRIYPQVYHGFLHRGCKKDCRSWLWKSQKGQKMRRVMKARGLPTPNY